MLKDRKYDFKLSFHYKEINCWDGSIEEEGDYEIVTDVLILKDEFMIINDLLNTYTHEWNLNNISNLKIEKIKKGELICQKF